MLGLACVCFLTAHSTIEEDTVFESTRLMLAEPVEKKLCIDIAIARDADCFPDWTHDSSISAT